MNDRNALDRLKIRSELVFERTVQLPIPVPDGFVLYYDNQRENIGLIASDIFEDMLTAGTWPAGKAFQVVLEQSQPTASIVSFPFEG
jgi:hypothetical protein